MRISKIIITLSIGFIARKNAKASIHSNNARINRIVLFGSFAREDFGVHSDLDLLIVLNSSALPIRERVSEFLEECSIYPTDVFPLTQAELDERLQGGDPFWTQALREGIECYKR